MLISLGFFNTFIGFQGNNTTSRLQLARERLQVRIGVEQRQQRAEQSAL